jgi:hypothetical protein
MEDTQMKKFYAGTTKGVSATQIKATDLLAIEITKDTTVEAIAEATAGNKILELLNNAMAEGRAAYAITSPLAHVKETVANVLQAKFMQRINAMIAMVEEADSVDALDALIEDGRVCNEVLEYVTDVYNARKAEKEAPVVPVAPVTVEPGIDTTEAQVLDAMNARGLVIGGTAKTAMGVGTVLGFVVGQIGTMVVVSVEGKQLTVMSTRVEGQAVVQNQTKTNEEVSVSMKNVSANQSNVVASTTPSLVLNLPVNAEAKAVVESAVEATNVEVPYEELTVEEREALEEARLQADLAKFAEAQENKSANASAVAHSSAAQALKALGGGAQTPAQGNRNTNAAPAFVQPAAQVRTNAPAVNNQPKTNNRGGNVQMTNVNNNNGAVAQQSQGRQGSTPSLAFNGGSVAGTRQGSTPTLALGGNTAFSAPAVGSAWANIAPVMELPTVEYTGTNGSNNEDFVWYVAEAAKYEGQILDLATLAANGFANPHIGITGMKFCKPESVAAFFNREVKENDMMWVEVFFGTTSYEFMISGNKGSEYKAAIFSRNIARKQTKGGTWFCEYETSRRTDKLQVVTQGDGVIREARKVWDRDAKAFVIHPEDAPFVVEVGGQGWVNVAPNYGIRVGQQVFIQVMVMMDEYLGLKAAREAK